MFNYNETLNDVEMKELHIFHCELQCSYVTNAFKHNFIKI